MTIKAGGIKNLEAGSDPGNPISGYSSALTAKWKEQYDQ